MNEFELPELINTPSFNKIRLRFFGGGAPKPPPPPTPISTPVELDVKAKEESYRKKMLARVGRQGTILTGPTLGSSGNQPLGDVNTNTPPLTTTNNPNRRY
jgi:hypothetical protein